MPLHSRPRAVISAFLDTPARFFLQAQNWLASLRQLGIENQLDIILHLAPDVPAQVEDRLFQMGARTVRVEPALMGINKFCNKLSQLESGVLAGYDKIILSDLDTFFLHNPLEFSDFTRVAGKPVDIANPPLAIFNQILAEAGLTCDYSTVPTLAGADAVVASCNFNGGLYLIPGSMADPVRQSWRKWAEFCAARGDILGGYLDNCDQIGFAMTLLEAQLPFENLDVFHNFPTHLSGLTQQNGTPIYSAIASGQIKMLHYHQRIEGDGKLQMTGTGWIDAQIRRANQILCDQHILNL